MDKNSYLISLSESEQTDFGRVDFADQSEPQKIFSAIWDLESQVNNGGFDQYFRYTDSESIAFSPAALGVIGATKCAAIVGRAISLVFGAPIPATEDERLERLDSLGDDALPRLEEIDSDFFGYPDNLTDLLFAFVAQHPSAFGPIPNDCDA